MKYQNKKYKWCSVLLVDGIPDGVELYKNQPWTWLSGDNLEGKITTFWENEKLTDKPVISFPSKVTKKEKQTWRARYSTYAPEELRRLIGEGTAMLAVALEVDRENQAKP